MKSVLVLLVSVLSLASVVRAKKIADNFSSGRIPPLKYEYSELNDLLTPQEAKAVCEEDLQCAGFTFKGSKNVNQKFPVYFFRYWTESAIEKLSHWTWYHVKRAFVMIPGTFEAKKKLDVTQNHMDDLLSLLKVTTSRSSSDHKQLKQVPGNIEKFKWKFPANVAAVETPIVISEPQAASAVLDKAKLLPSVDFANLKLHPKTDVVTFVRLKSGQVHDQEGKVCCKKYDNQLLEDAFKKFSLQKVGETPCFESYGQFRSRFLSKRIPTLLKSCASICTHLNWTLSDVVRAFPSNSAVTWRSFPRGNKEKDEKLINALQQNEIDFVFGTLHQPTVARDLLKYVLDHDDDDGEVGGPKLDDLLSELMGLEEPQKVISWIKKGYQGAIQVKKAGASDVKYTQVSGKEIWYLLPMDKSTSKNLSCSKSCSDQNVSSSSWLTALLTLLSGRKLYGNSVKFAITSQGDTLYIPDGWLSFHIGLEDSVGFMQSSRVSQNLEELAVNLDSVVLSKLNKILQGRDDKRREWRRLKEILSQIQKGFKKKK